MEFMNICAPALLYVVFSLIHIIIDTFKGMYNTAFMKAIVMIMVTILLNILCQSGLGVIAWIIVFIPFILMTIIVSLLLYIFGLNASTGTLNYTCGNTTETEETTNTNTTTVVTDASGNILIYDPYFDPIEQEIYYSAPNIVIPPHIKTTTTTTSYTEPSKTTNNTNYRMPPTGRPHGFYF